MVQVCDNIVIDHKKNTKIKVFLMKQNVLNLKDYLLFWGCVVGN